MMTPRSTTSLTDAISVDSPRPVTVVVPVYRGLEETRDCVESVLASSNRAKMRLLIVNDCSPEAGVNAYLKTLNHRDVQVVTNETNLGFVGTVNRGMELAGRDDVILLNSDTRVHGDWIDRLQAHAYSRTRVASVSPFSNNATICSYPTIGSHKDLPEGVDLATIDEIASRANRGRSVEVPTTVGFCMYIRREALIAVGDFDAEAFGKGYGEENDFCMRAISVGWRHLLACDTFVYHRGEVSFGSEHDDRKANALKILLQRYPRYSADVQNWIKFDPPAPYRTALTAARYRESGKPTLLVMTLALGGGTQKHVDKLIESILPHCNVLVMKPTQDRRQMRLISGDPRDGLDIEFDGGSQAEDLAQLCRMFGVSRIHIHHLIGAQMGVNAFVRDLGVPFDITLHDYYYVCPRINLMQVNGKFCGEPDEATCNRCIQSDKTLERVEDIVWWRRRFQWMFKRAERVICPSEDVANRFRRYYPSANFVVALHDSLHNYQFRDPQTPKFAGRRLRIGMLGGLALHKGSRYAAQCIAEAERRNAGLEFVVIGKFADPTSDWLLHEARESGRFEETRSYEFHEVGAMLAEAKPDLIWFAARWPETYSYTLSEALEYGCPVVAPDLGAFAERLKGRPFSWIVDHSLSPSALVDYFEGIANRLREKPEPRTVAASGSPERFYLEDYLAPLFSRGSEHPSNGYAGNGHPANGEATNGHAENGFKANGHRDRSMLPKEDASDSREFV